MRIVIVLFISLISSPPAFGASHQDWQSLKASGVQALKKKNYFDAKNKLAGSLLLQLKAKSRDVESAKKLLSVALEKIHQPAKSKIVMRLSGKPLCDFVTKEYNPNVWYDRAGGIYNNVIPKTTIVGTARMEADGTIRAPIESPGPTHAASIIILKPGDKDYDMFIKHVGGLKPGESKPVPAFNCISRRDRRLQKRVDQANH